MSVTDLAGLAAAIAPGRRLLGLDVGKKTLGLALSDVLLTIASPLTVVRRTRLAADLRALAGIVEEHAVGGFVLGLPVEMNGREGPRCQSVRQFGRDLAMALPLPCAFWDERLSTAAVERVLIGEADLSRRRRAALVDKLAAAYILQGALDALAALRPRP